MRGDYGKAERIHQRALAISEKAFGPEHPAQWWWLRVGSRAGAGASS